MRRNVVRALLPLMALPLMVACPFQQEKDDTEKDILTLLALPEQMEINGNWKDGFNWAQHTIGVAKTLDGEVSGNWIDDSSANLGGSRVVGVVVEFSNQIRTAYVRTGVPSWCGSSGDCECYDAQVCFNRNVWTISNGKVYYCQIVYNKPTLNEAKADPTTADASSPSSGGCGFGSWTELKPR